MGYFFVGMMGTFLDSFSIHYSLNAAILRRLRPAGLGPLARRPDGCTIMVHAVGLSRSPAGPWWCLFQFASCCARRRLTAAANRAVGHRAAVWPTGP